MSHFTLKEWFFKGDSFGYTIELDILLTLWEWLFSPFGVNLYTLRVTLYSFMSDSSLIFGSDSFGVFLLFWFFTLYKWLFTSDSLRAILFEWLSTLLGWFFILLEWLFWSDSILFESDYSEWLDWSDSLLVGRDSLLFYEWIFILFGSDSFGVSLIFWFFTQFTHWYFYHHNRVCDFSVLPPCNRVVLKLEQQASDSWTFLKFKLASYFIKF